MLRKTGALVDAVLVSLEGALVEWCADLADSIVADRPVLHAEQCPRLDGGCLFGLEQAKRCRPRGELGDLFGWRLVGDLFRLGKHRLVDLAEALDLQCLDGVDAERLDQHGRTGQPVGA